MSLAAPPRRQVLGPCVDAFGPRATSVGGALVAALGYAVLAWGGAPALGLALVTSAGARCSRSILGTRFLVRHCILWKFREIAPVF